MKRELLRAERLVSRKDIRNKIISIKEGLAFNCKKVEIIGKRNGKVEKYKTGC